MKKKIIVIVVAVIFILVLGFIIRNKIIVNKDNQILEQVGDLLKPVYVNYEMKIENDYHNIIFTNKDDYEVKYHLYDNKIDSVNIYYNLSDNQLTSDETIQNIEEIYSMVTSNLNIVKEYFDDDFLWREKYLINDHDKSYLKDLLDYNVESSDWSVGYTYKEHYHYLHIGYYLHTSYDNEGYDNFSIYIS